MWSQVVDQSYHSFKPLFRLQPPADGRPFYLVKNSLSSLIKEVEQMLAEVTSEASGAEAKILADAMKTLNLSKEDIKEIARF